MPKIKFEFNFLYSVGIPVNIPVIGIEETPVIWVQPKVFEQIEFVYTSGS